MASDMARKMRPFVRAKPPPEVEAMAITAKCSATRPDA